ncbi:PLDc N-terminal domain-containing protein [Nocardioides sp.]|uniref:SHOCT domain-containing protein n=1 Tax=Nocardioides sp. TaxID=35761 RepID=UPI003D0F353B
MDSITTNFWDVLLWSFWFFIWISAVMVWFRCIFDMFGDRTLNGGAKAGWAVVLILLPWIGALIYLIARGQSMAERQMALVAQQRSAQEQYIQRVASTSGGAAEQIASAKSLLDSGTINQAEFETLKAKALA